MNFAALARRDKCNPPHNSPRSLTAIQKSERDGEYQVSIEGAIIQTGFETEHEAKCFARGFVLGSEARTGDKGFDAASDTAGA